MESYKIISLPWNLNWGDIEAASVARSTFQAEASELFAVMISASRQLISKKLFKAFWNVHFEIYLF